MTRPASLLRTRCIAPLAGLVLVLAAGTGCLTPEAESQQADTAAAAPTSAAALSASAGPTTPAVVPWDGTGFAPPVTVLVDGVSTPSRVWTACYDQVCADGSPGLDGSALVDVGSPESLSFSFPDPGWRFTASFHALDRPCEPSLPGVVTTTGEHTFTAAPPDPAGHYRVDLSGRGPSGGDVVTSVVWTTPADGLRPAPPSSPVGADTSATTDPCDGFSG